MSNDTKYTPNSEARLWGIGLMIFTATVFVLLLAGAVVR